MAEGVQPRASADLPLGKEFCWGEPQEPSGHNRNKCDREWGGSVRKYSWLIAEFCSRYYGKTRKLRGTLQLRYGIQYFASTAEEHLL
jgi:hypothetical protein